MERCIVCRANWVPYAFLRRLYGGSLNRSYSKVFSTSPSDSPQPSESTFAAASAQAIPLGEYYTLLLHDRLASKVSGTPPPARGPSIVFRAAVSGPGRRSDRAEDAGSDLAVTINGIVIPPRPKEPDNCCMSGCVNCVWDMYREDLESWAQLKSQAEKRSRVKEGVASAGVDGSGNQDGRKLNMAANGNPRGHGMVGETIKEEQDNSDAAAVQVDQELFDNVPVGIREFMKQEKRLREKRARERSDSS